MAGWRVAAISPGEFDQGVRTPVPLPGRVVDSRCGVPTRNPEWHVRAWDATDVQHVLDFGTSRAAAHPATSRWPAGSWTEPAS
jgi:hypothetical protein